MEKILDIKNLCVSFPMGSGSNHGFKEVVRGVSFEVSPGESLGIVGESGSGKSMTALALMGLLPKEAKLEAERFVFFSETGGKDLLSLDAQAYRSLRGKAISMIFQDPMTALNPSMRCGKQVVEAFCAHQKIGAEEAKILTLSLFERLRIPNPKESFRKFPHQMSGGQLQRVLIAIALANRPRLLIADEPTTALDVSVQQEILALLSELRQEYGLSLLFISHDLGVVAQVCDKVLVMQKGQCVEYAPVTEIFTAPKHPYTQALIACRPSAAAKNQILKTVQDFMPESQE